MNNQPKFKKGDRVQIPYLYLTGTVTECIERPNGYRIDCSDGVNRYIVAREVEPYSPTPNMLAIPDDHVFEVKWRKIDAEEDYKNIIVFSGSTGDIWHTSAHGFAFTNNGYTHYLTEADLLKLPFQK